jgi:NAD(P)H-flavin reductase
VPDVVPQLFPDLRDHSVFVAGPPAFVADCVAAVTALGALPDRTYVEGYHAQAPVEVPPKERLAV